MLRRTLRASPWLPVVVGLALGSPGVTRGGEERTPLLKAGVADEDWAFVRSYFAVRYMQLDEDLTAELFMSLAHVRTKEEAWSHIRKHVLASGYHDLDGDGTDELVVFLGHSCGTIGCQTQIFSRKDGGWEPVRVQLRADDDPDLCVSGSGPDGYPILYSGRDAVWWTGFAYEQACLVDCGDEAEDNGQGGGAPREVLLQLVRQGCGESK